MKERHQVRWYRKVILYIALCLFLAFTCVYIIAELVSHIPLSPLLEVVRDFLLSFYPSIALIFFTFLFTVLFYAPIRDKEREIDEERLLDKIEERLTLTFQDVAMKSQNVSASLRQAGVTDIFLFSKIHYPRLFERMARCKHRLYILDSWMWDNINDLEDVLHQLALRNIPVHVLLLDPDSEFAIQRARDLRLDEQHVSKSIRGNVKSFANFRQKFGMAQLKVKYYKALPSFSLYICDNQVFVGFYFHMTPAMHAPFFDILIKSEIGEYTVLGKHFEEEFSIIWELAKFAAEFEKDV